MHILIDLSGTFLFAMGVDREDKITSDQVTRPFMLAPMTTGRRQRRETWDGDRSMSYATATTTATTTTTNAQKVNENKPSPRPRN